MRPVFPIVIIQTVLTILFSTTLINARPDVQLTEDFFVEAFVTNESPFLGEQIIYTLRYYAHTLPSGITETLPGFEGFWQSHTFYTPATNRIQTINNRQYYVGELYVELVPLHTGQVEISPAELRIPSTVFRDGIQLQSDPIIINTSPLPPGAPDEFNGAVGQFHAEINIRERVIDLGEPIYLTITVSGTGNLEQMPAPQLPNLPNWRRYSDPVRFSYTTDSAVALRYGEKTFQWMLIPEETGTHTLPTIIFAYFNPQTVQYHAIASPTFTIDVFPGAAGIRELPALGRGTTTAGTLSLKPMTTTMRLTTQTGPTIWFWILPSLIAGISALSIFVRTTHQKHRQRQQHKSALQSAVKQLQDARKLAGNQASEQIVAAIYTYFAHKTGYTRRALGRAKGQGIARILQERNIAPDRIDTLITHLAEAETGKYAPNGLKQDFLPLIEHLIETLTIVDRSWAQE
jgi:hypothetical protein